MMPERYLYLVEIDNEQIKAVFAADHIGDREGMIEFERELRGHYAVDAPDSGLDLRSSEDRPLRAEVWAQLAWKRAGR